jgi:hypothetical protein
MTTTMTLLYAGSQAIICGDEGSMQMALYLLGKRVGNYNLEIATDKREIIFLKGREKTQIKNKVKEPVVPCLQPKISKLKLPARETPDFLYTFVIVITKFLADFQLLHIGVREPGFALSSRP